MEEYAELKRVQQEKVMAGLNNQIMINKSLKGVYNNDFNKTTNQYFTAYTTKLNLNAL